MYYPINAFNTSFIISVIISTCLLLLAFPIYRAKGWRAMKTYLIVMLLAWIFALFVYGDKTDDLSHPILSGALLGPGLPFAMYLFFMSYNLFKTKKYKRQIDKLVEARLNDLTPVPDNELLKIKHMTSTNNNDLFYDEIRGKYERSELTKKWKTRMKNRHGLEDPFLWRQFAKQEKLDRKESRA